MMNNVKWIQAWALVCLTLLGAVAWAQSASDTLQSVAHQLQSELKANEARYRGSDGAVHQLVDRVVAPYIDFMEMSRWVVGRQAWQGASPQARQAFTQAFRELLIQTYAGSLVSYKDHTIEYLPERKGASSKGRVQVDTIVRAPGNEAVRVSYRMWQQGGRWKVYDIIIEGVSLLKGFQSQFADDLRAGGLDQVTKRIQRHTQGK